MVNSSFSEYFVNYDANELKELENFIYENNYNKNKEYFTNVFLLDTNKEYFTLIEKYVYLIAMYQFQQLNIKYDSSIYHIEFWWRNDVYRDFHIDCDEEYRTDTGNYKTPLLSNVFYLCDSSYATILTDVDFEKYKYKDFERNSVSISFPKIGKLLSFNSKYFHGVLNMFATKSPENRSVLMINLWNERPLRINTYIPEKNGIYKKSNDISIIKNCPAPFVIYHNIKYDLFEGLLYSKKYELIHEYGNIIRNMNTNLSTFHFLHKSLEPSLNVTSLDKKRIPPTIILSPITIENVFTKNACEWINIEMRDDLTIDISTYPSLFRFILLHIQNSIFPRIKEAYSVSKNINITKISIYNERDQPVIEDNVAIISLNKQSILHNKIKYILNEGDVMVGTNIDMNQIKNCIIIQFEL